MADNARIALLRRPDGRPANPRWVEEAAGILVTCFPMPEGYPTPAEATAEMDELLANAACLLVAVEAGEPGAVAAPGAAPAGGQVVGLVGALPQYRGHAWELHPLAVHPDHRGRGLGRALVAALEAEAARAGISVIYLGTDDTEGRTNLGGADLFPGVLARAAAIANRGVDRPPHPFSFYQRVGFEVVGLIPDANGFGKPDIIMAKRVAPAPAPGAREATAAAPMSRSALPLEDWD